VNHFVMKDIPALKEEPYMNSAYDNIIRINFQLSKVNDVDGISLNVTTTWQQLIKDLLDEKEFGKYLTQSTKLAKDLVKSLAITSQSPMQKCLSIIRFVKLNFSWNGKLGKYSDKSANDFFLQKSGNDASVNLFLAGMLNTAGLEAYPVLLSTRDHGKINMDYPFLHFFNYVVVVVKIDGKLMLTDATNPYCPDDRVPPQCINGSGLIINNEKAEWVMLDQTNFSRTHEEMMVRLNPAMDSLITTFTKTLTGYDAFSLKNLTGNSKEKIRDQFENQNEIVIGELQIKNEENPQKPLVIQGQLGQLAESAGSRIYISPFLTHPISESPFQRLVSNYPIDFNYLRESKYHSFVIIPDGYRVRDLPASFHEENDFITISYDAKSDGAMVEVTASYRLKKSFYPPESYMVVKTAFSSIVRKFNEKVVLEK
jgi:hypothetical protein